MYYFLLKILNKFFLGFLCKKKDLIIFLKYNHIMPVTLYFKHNSVFKAKALMDLCVNDNINDEKRFELTYSFIFETNRIFLKTKLSPNKYILSLSSVYASANWLEREAWDMFGIKFLLHPDLRRILTDYGFKGYPLRKDFPITGYYEIQYDDISQSIIVIPIELSQKYRSFELVNPWIKWKI
jgi:NADH:ubiquinone oxidoreductase subunit C